MRGPLAGLRQCGKSVILLAVTVSQRVLWRPFVSQQRAHERRWVLFGNSMRQDAVERVMNKKRVLFVCLGNICRSPTAEGVLRAIATREFPALPVAMDSAGTANYHVGEPPDRRSVAAARRRGYDLSSLRARQVRPDDFEHFDYLLAMDRANLAELVRQRPATASAQLGLFLDYAPDCGFEEVPDPYYGGIEDFERVLDLCEAGARGLLQRLTDG